MESITDIVDPVLPALAMSNNTTPATTSEPTTPKDSPEVEPVSPPPIKANIKLGITNAETKTENVAPTPAVNSLLSRPTLPHAQTDTEFEVAKEVQRVERRWRGMYDRNRTANPGATREPQK